MLAASWAQVEEDSFHQCVSLLGRWRRYSEANLDFPAKLYQVDTPFSIRTDGYLLAFGIFSEHHTNVPAFQGFVHHSIPLHPCPNFFYLHHGHIHDDLFSFLGCIVLLICACGCGGGKESSTV